jgi:hypothetical protein
MQNEHDDDLEPSVDTRNELQTDEYPKTSDELEEEPDQPESQRDDQDDDIVGK